MPKNIPMNSSAVPLNRLLPSYVDNDDRKAHFPRRTVRCHGFVTAYTLKCPRLFYRKKGKIITETFLRGCNFLPAGKSCPLWSGSRNTCNPVIRAAWSATSEPPVTTSGKALSVSTTRSQSAARGPSASVHLPPLTAPRSNLSTHIPLKLQRSYPPFPATDMICTLMLWTQTMLTQWKPSSVSLFCAGRPNYRNSRETSLSSSQEDEEINKFNLWEIRHTDIHCTLNIKTSGLSVCCGRSVCLCVIKLCIIKYFVTLCYTLLFVYECRKRNISLACISNSKNNVQADTVRNNKYNTTPFKTRSRVLDVSFADEKFEVGSHLIKIFDNNICLL